MSDDKLDQVNSGVKPTLESLEKRVTQIESDLKNLRTWVVNIQRGIGQHLHGRGIEIMGSMQEPK